MGALGGAVSGSAVAERATKSLDERAVQRGVGALLRFSIDQGGSSPAEK